MKLLVVGASSDIGLDFINRVIDGYEVVAAHYLHMNDGLDHIRVQWGKKIIFIKADLSVEEEVQMLIKQVKDSIGYPDHIVHLPAQCCENEKFHKIPWDVFQRDMDISIKSIIQVLQEFLPIMAKGHGGSVVFMLSHAVRQIVPAYCSNYVMTKYALLGLLKALSQEYAGKGIRINGVSPGWTDTKFIERQPEIVIKKNIDDSPIGRLMRPEDITPTIAYLLSDAATCINGENIRIASGR